MTAVLLALAALAVLSQPERNLYEVHEVPAVEEGAAIERQDTEGGID